jgi:MFS family permease
MKTHTQNPFLVWQFSSAFVMLQFLLQSSTGVMVTPLMHEFGLTTTEIGFLSAAFLYPYLVFQIPGGILADRFGPRRVLMASSALFSMAALMFALGRHSETLFMARILMGASSAPAFACMLMLVGRWFSAKRFAFMAGISETTGMCGAAAGTWALAYAVTHLGWRVSVGVCALVALTCCVGVVLFVSNHPKHKPDPEPEVPTEFIDPHFESGDDGKFSWADLRVLLKRRVIWVGSLYGAGTFSVLTALGALWIVPFLEVRYHVPLHAAALGSGMIFVGAAMGAPILGFIAGRVDKIKRVMFICAVGAFIMSVIVIGFTSFLPYWPAMVCLFVLGMFSSSYVLPFIIVRSKVKPSRHGTAMAFVNMLGIAMGAPILQPLMGWILSLEKHGAASAGSHLSVGIYQWALSPICVALALSVFLSILIRE